MERFVSAGGVRARIIEEGSGEPVLLIHGVGAFAENWKPVLPALAAAGYRAVACDLPGHGQSGRARGARYFAAEDPYYARFVLDLLGACGIERADLVGHSLGGGIAVVTALVAPRRVRRLVLVSPGGAAELTRPLRMAALPFAQLLARFLSDEAIRDFVRACFHDPACVPEWLNADAIRYTRAGAGSEFARVLRHVATFSGLRKRLREDWIARVPELRCPTLIMWGREDVVLPVEQASAAARLIPHARLEILPKAGHLVMLEQPTEFLRALLTFLRAA